MVEQYAAADPRGRDSRRPQADPRTGRTHYHREQLVSVSANRLRCFAVTRMPETTRWRLPRPRDVARCEPVQVRTGQVVAGRGMPSGYSVVTIVKTRPMTTWRRCTPSRTMRRARITRRSGSASRATRCGVSRVPPNASSSTQAASRNEVTAAVSSTSGGALRCARREDRWPLQTVRTVARVSCSSTSVCARDTSPSGWYCHETMHSA